MTATRPTARTTPAEAFADSQVARAIELSGATALAILDDPTLLDDIPNGCTLIPLPAGEPEFAERRLALGIASVRQGQNVYFKHVPAGFGKDLDDQT